MPSSSQPHPTTEDPFATLHDGLLCPGPGIVDLRSAAEDLRDHPDLLRSSLMTLLRYDVAVTTVADRSSVHANGFAKIVLHVGDHHSVRLHVWHRRNGRWLPDTMPHGHRWEFASWVVVGRLQETTFAMTDDGLRYERLWYGRTPDGRQFLRSDGHALLQPGAPTLHLEGTVYARSRDVIHTATPAGAGLVASLVLQGPREREPTAVYRLPGGEHDHTDWPLSPADVRALVVEVPEALR